MIGSVALAALIVATTAGVLAKVRPNATVSLVLLLLMLLDTATTSFDVISEARLETSEFNSALLLLAV